MFTSFKEFLSIALPLSGLILFTACGKAGSDKSPRMTVSTNPQTEVAEESETAEEVATDGAEEVEQKPAEQQEDEGVYRAVLKSLNNHVSGETTGSVDIRVVGDDFFVESRITGSPIAIKHLQNIFSGTKCPDVSSDINKDGLIDISESVPYSGKVLIPLDSDLSEQLNGIEYGPISNNAGNYVYRRSTTLSRLLADLRSLDPDPRDFIIKLKPEEELNLSGRAVIIHGLKHTTPLSASIEGYGPFTAEQSLPIACGILVRQ